MPQTPRTDDAERVACEVCLTQIPRSEAMVPEASDYVAYFCGLACFEKWKQRIEADETPARTSESAPQR